MNDSEILKLAAKAAIGAGLPLHYGPHALQPDPHWQHGADEWRPFADDGDALRLAVTLHIDFKAFGATVRTWVGDPVAQRVIASIEEPCGDDPYAATRRAIVRAAAEMGKTIE